MNKEEWACEILANEKFCNQETEKLINEEINHEFLLEIICEKTLLKLISCIQKKHIARFLSEYSPFFNADEMTPKVFNALLAIKSSYKKSILIGLCHAKISFYQLLKLDDLNLDRESLLQLIIRCIENEAFSAYDLSLLLERSLKYANFSQDLDFAVKFVGEDNICKMKQNILQSYF